MEGSPVRGQERPSIVRLNESADLENFQSDLVRIVASDLHHTDVFFGLFDTAQKTLQLPSWVRSHLERHPGLLEKLEKGEMAGISHTEENPVLRPAAAARSSVVLIPVIASATGALQGAIGLVSPLDGPQLSAEETALIRQLAYDIPPILLRLRELQTLRQENERLTESVCGASETEQAIARLNDQKNELAALIEMRSHLQANVAHELRTPLAAIRGYSRMILDGRGGEINSTQKEYLRIVTENTNRLIGMVGWMSYVAELSSQHFKLSAFDLRDAWTDAARANRQIVAEKSLSVTEQIPDESFLVVGDREKLTYVLGELVGAAATLASASSAIALEFSHGREKEVTVKLSGKGIALPQDALSRIFERSFNTISKPSAQAADASAISLSGVYDVVGMHGGRVFVNSTSGQGTTFLFTLPAITLGEENSHEQAVNSGRRRR
jgi:signal transduction histidine kinase